MTADRPSRRITARVAATWATLLVLVGAIAVLGLVWGQGFGVTQVQCDGTVPAWMVPDDYDGGGCVEIRPAWEGLLPENSDHSDYCLGLCADVAPLEASGSG